MYSTEMCTIIDLHIIYLFIYLFIYCSYNSLYLTVFTWKAYILLHVFEVRKAADEIRIAILFQFLENEESERPCSN
jgi:hypothetical protein